MAQLREVKAKALPSPDMKPLDVVAHQPSILGIPLDKLAEIPVEKMEQLFALHQKIEADKSRREFDAAFAQMQPELPIITKSGKAHHGTAYAKWEDIVEDITPIIARYGFGISFRVKSSANALDVTCVLSHKSGHREETGYTLPLDTTGSKNPIQAIGSSTSYGKRYTACALLNIVTREEDDDANGAFAAETIERDHVKVLEDLLAQSGLDKERLLRHWQIEDLSDIRPERYNAAKLFLNAQIKRNAKENKGV